MLPCQTMPVTQSNEIAANCPCVAHVKSQVPMRNDCAPARARGAYATLVQGQQTPTAKDNVPQGQARATPPRSFRGDAWNSAREASTAPPTGCFAPFTKRVPPTRRHRAKRVSTDCSNSRESCGVLFSLRCVAPCDSGKGTRGGEGSSVCRLS